MVQQPPKPRDSVPGAETLIAALYHQLLDCWNQRNATAYAALFTEGGLVVGFDGSQMVGRQQIESELRRIFADHVTATYVSKVKAVTLLSSEVSILQAVAGMIPPMKADIHPDRNAVQTLVAVQVEDTWRIASFQNTPAQFHGRPDLVAELNAELRRLL